MLKAFLLALCFLVTSLVSVSVNAQIDSHLEAKRLLERIAGIKVPGDHALIAPMKAHIENNRWYEAAELALSHPSFLNVTVKQMALKMSTREETIQIPLNDFTATFIGVVRDGIDARQLLTGNFQYLGDTSRVPASLTVRSEFDSHIVRSNDHFADLDALSINLSEVLKMNPGQMILQSRSNTIVYNPDPAGVLTSRAFMGAHAIAGTNRRPVEYTFRQFLCAPIEEWADSAASDARIGRDIDRYPGGDHTRFQVSCKGCHTVMDGFRGAFAKWDFSSNAIINRDVQINSAGNPETGVVGKMGNNNSVFPQGFVTRDNSFVNNANGVANQEKFGWRGDSQTGFGVKDFGRMIASSQRFSECMVERVFESVCRKEISINSNPQFIRDHAKRFEGLNYDLKKLFRMVSVTKECVE